MPARRNALGISLLLVCPLVLGVPSRAAATGTMRQAGGDTLSASAKRVLAWLPGDRSTTGWKRVKPPQVFGPDNLWEFIDGAADSYVTYGFEELVSVTCTDAQLAAEATIDVYRMGDALNAFGIYAQERNARAAFLPIGAEGYEAANILNFWNSRYYVKLRATPANPRVAAALRTLAKRISDGIGAPTTLGRAVPAFPRAGQVAHSVKYVPRNVLGQSYLSNGFEAQYNAGATRWRMVTAAFPTAKEAAEGLTRYKTFVASAGRIAREIPSPGEGGFVGSDPYNGLLVAVRSGQGMVIAVGAPSESAALDMVSAMVLRSR